MAVIPVNLDDIKESKPVPVGRYDLVISECNEAVSKKGKPQYVVSIGIEGHNDAPNVGHWVSLPAEGDEKKAFDYKVLLLKRFCAMFGKPLSGSSIDTTQIAMSLAGARAKGSLSLDKEMEDNGQGGQQEKQGGKVFNRLVVPQLADEGVGRTAPTPPKR